MTLISLKCVHCMSGLGIESVTDCHISCQSLIDCRPTIVVIEAVDGVEPIVTPSRDIRQKSTNSLSLIVIGLSLSLQLCYQERCGHFKCTRAMAKNCDWNVCQIRWSASIWRNTAGLCPRISCARRRPLFAPLFTTLRSLPMRPTTAWHRMLSEWVLINDRNTDHWFRRHMSFVTHFSALN